MNVFFYLYILIILCLNTAAYCTIDHDYWARLLQGSAFWTAGHIMKQDIFSYAKTHLWLDHEWGSSIIFSFLQDNFGFSGILIFKTLLAFLIFFIIFKTIKLQTDKNNNFLNVLLFSAAVYAVPSITQSGLRCHFFTFLFFALYIYILELAEKKGKNALLFILPPLFLIWCNMHGGCVSGLGLIFIYAIGRAFNKKPFKTHFLILAACTASMFVNPYGIDYVIFIFTAAVMPRPNITEWMSPLLYGGAAFMLPFKLLSACFIILAAKNIKLLKTDCTKLILLIVCAAVSFKSIKSTPFFIIVSMIFLYEYAAAALPKSRAASIASAAGVIILSALSIRSFFFLSEQPFKAAEFISINRLYGRLLAPMEAGSYLAYKLFPSILIYMDGRYEEVYYKETKEMLDDFYNSERNPQKILSDEPEYIIAPADAAVNNMLAENSRYKVIWADEKNWLYARADIVKQSYKRPSEDLNYYIKTAFKTHPALMLLLKNTG